MDLNPKRPPLLQLGHEIMMRNPSYARVFAGFPTPPGPPLPRSMEDIINETLPPVKRDRSLDKLYGGSETGNSKKGLC